MIATIAKNDKKISKTGRKPLLPKSNFPVPVAKKSFQQTNTLSETSTAKVQPLVNNLNTQVKQYKSKCVSDLNKENVFNKNSQTKIDILQKEDKEHNKINGNLECNKLDLFDHSMNVSWKDGSILPQTFLPLNKPQDIRRATYIKDKSCNNILHKYNTAENAENVENTAQSDISIMLNKFTLTSTDALASSPQVKIELTQPINLQNSDKHRTFYIIDTQEVPAIQPAGSHTLSPNKFEMSFVNDMNNLIASSPIGKLQYSNTPKEPLNQNEHMKHFAVNHSTQKSECEYFSFEVNPENVEEAKKAGELYIEISPPKKHSHSRLTSISTPSAKMGRVTKNKSLYDIKSAKKLHVISTSKFLLLSFFFLIYLNLM